MHPKHDLDLDFQGQHTAKRLILGIHEPSAVHVDSTKYELRALSLVFPYSRGPGPITYSRQDMESISKKCTHGGHPLEFPLMVNLPT